MPEDILLVPDGTKIEIYRDKSGKEKIGEDTLKGNRYFMSVYCPQKNDNGEDVVYKAFALDVEEDIVKAVLVVQL